MPTARKKGASNKLIDGGELKLGDLVLAKVKGFPAWPAKVSRPEDWERVPDTKKYFVEFFGTREIAFVAPVDIQAFTSELKTKLLARCKGKSKTVKYFAQAVEEICAAFEELQNHDESGVFLGYDALDSRDGHNIEPIEGPKTENLCSGDVKRSSFLGESSVAEDIQTAAMKDSIGHLYEMISRRKGSESRSLGQIPASFTALSLISPVKEEKTSKSKSVVARCELSESSRATCTSPHHSDSDTEKDSSYYAIGTKDATLLVGASAPLKPTVREDKKTRNVDKSKGLYSGAKRKADGITSHANDSESARRDGALEKISAGGHASRSSDIKKFESNAPGKASKRLQKGPKLLDAAMNSQWNMARDSEGCGNGEYLRQKNGQLVPEQSQCVKKAKLENRLTDDAQGSILKNGKSDLIADVLGEQAVPPVAKHRPHLLEALSNDDRSNLGTEILKNDLAKKRCAVRLCDEDDDPKTPVHGGSAKSASKVRLSGLIPDSVKLINENHEYANGTGQHLIGFCRASGSLNGHHPPVKSTGEILMASPPAKLYSSMKANVSHILGPEAKEMQLVKASKQDLISPTKTSQVVSFPKKSVDHHRSTWPLNKGTNPVTPSKSQNVSGKDSISVPGASNSYQSHISAFKSKPTTLGERSKVLPKTVVGLIDPNTSHHNQRHHDPVSDGSRLENTRDKSGSLVDSKATVSAFSMKNLIAAAQAKRKQSRVQNMSSGNEDSVLAPGVNFPVRSPIPSAGQVFQPVAGSLTQHDAERSQTHGPITSLPGRVRQLELEEPEVKGLSLVNQSSGSTLSGGTEAVVSRDAFEGMIETLSRTKESIGRATRLAIDCAKYGIATEVVDLLLRKLENESNLSHRVDIFFLVDSITQCSHSQKGVAGASYLPAVQAALPRLLGAAAPSGPNARENRRQCLKVLRLWLERKILPDSVLRRFMDDIGSLNDDAISGLSFRRPSRAERSVDDPIREMEGMLVDEYGSNATFNLPGFLSTHGFVDDEEDEDIPFQLNLTEASPLRPCRNASTGPEAEVVTPSYRHHILEDVEGELEMEDVSGHSKSPYCLSEKDEQVMDTEFDPNASHIIELPSLEGSPPLPPGSPPPPPPLPSSPPPSLPPQQPFLPSPPPHPPSTFLSQPAQPTLLPPLAPDTGLHLAAIAITPTVNPHVALRPPTVLPPAQMAGVSSSWQLEYGQGDLYSVPQGAPLNQQFQQPQQFQPSQASFAPRAFQPTTLPQHRPGHFIFNNPTVTHHMPHPLSHSLPPRPPSHPNSTSGAEDSRQFGDEQWRSNHTEYDVGNHHNTWVNGGQTQSCPKPPFVGEAYFQPPESRPSLAISIPPPSGHGMIRMLSSRPDMASISRWRPI